MGALSPGLAHRVCSCQFYKVTNLNTEIFQTKEISHLLKAEIVTIFQINETESVFTLMA